MEKKRFKLKSLIHLLECPLCHKPLHFKSDNSIICFNNHCFDISSKGTVNFLPNQKPLIGYNARFFENRREFMQQGFYDQVIKAITEVVLTNNFSKLVDAGCGDGFYDLKIAQETSAKILAFDISKEAIKQASRDSKDICWLTADIVNIPIKRQSIDCILNIFSPANYTEFQRILHENGTLIKVLPGKNHLLELRNLVSQQLKNKKYSNQKIKDYFSQHFSIIDKINIRQTLPISTNNLKLLLDMTPLMFGIKNKNLDYSNITNVTIETDILIGKPLSHKER